MHVRDSIAGCGINSRLIYTNNPLPIHQWVLVFPVFSSDIFIYKRYKLYKYLGYICSYLYYKQLRHVFFSGDKILVWAN